MILRSLKLENIRSYTHEKIEFSEGSMLLSGDIGSGKSTILLAIEFALFGIMRSGLSGNMLLRHGKNRGSVELSFETEGKEYVIMRSLRRTKDSVAQESGYIITDGRKTEATPVELKAKIIGILGYPEELVSRSKSLIYRYTVYTPQEEMKNILFEDKDTRLDTLRKIFGIDKYKTIRENSVLFVRELKKKQSELKARTEEISEIDEKLSLLNVRRSDAESKAYSLKKDLGVVSAELEKKASSVRVAEEEMKVLQETAKQDASIRSKLESEMDEMERLKNRLRNAESDISGINEKISKYKGIDKKLPVEELEKKTEALQENMSEGLKKRSELEEKIRSLGDKAKTLKEELSGMAKESEKAIVLEAEISSLEQKIARKKEQEELMDGLIEKEKKAYSTKESNIIKIDEAKNHIKNLEKDICPTCLRKIDEKHKEEVLDGEGKKIKSLEEENRSLELILKKIDKNKDIVRSNLEKISRYEKELEQKKEQLKAAKRLSKEIIDKQKIASKAYSDMKQAQEELNAMEDIKKVSAELISLKKELTDARNINLMFREKENLKENLGEKTKELESIKKEISEKESSLKDLSKKTEELREKLSGYEEKEKRFVSLKHEADSVRERQKKIEIEIAGIMKEAKMLDEQIEELKKKKAALEVLKEKINELSRLQTWFEEFFLNLMTTMEKHIMASIHSEFSTLLKEWFSILIDNIDIMLDDEFTPILIQDGYETDIESLSGGEKTSVALAYRLALNKVINDLISEIKTKDLIILDEPTDGFSTEQLDRVRDVLEELGMKQMIIVSHEAKLESYVDKILRVAKNDNLSRVIS